MLAADISCNEISPDNKVYGANMGSIWGRQDPGGPHVGPMKLTIWVVLHELYIPVAGIYILMLEKYLGARCGK